MGIRTAGGFFRPPPVIIIIRKFAAVNPVKEDGKIVSLALLAATQDYFAAFRNPGDSVDAAVNFQYGNRRERRLAARAAGRDFNRNGAEKCLMN